MKGRIRRDSAAVVVPDHAGELCSSEGKSLRDLVSTLGQIKAQMSVTQRTIRDCQHAAAEAREREAQEQRAATVREARVARAKELRPVEDRCVSEAEGHPS